MEQPLYLMAHDLNIPAESVLAGWQAGRWATMSQSVMVTIWVQKQMCETGDILLRFGCPNDSRTFQSNVHWTADLTIGAPSGQFSNFFLAGAPRGQAL